MNIEPSQPARKGPADWFTGDVYIDAIHVRKAEPSMMACGWGHFTPGARTAWHSHWHGAVTDGFMAHIARYEGTEDGDGASWLEHVTDEQYKAAAAAAQAS